MLVNVKFYKIFTIFILLSVNLSADEKDQIVTQLNNLKSLEFTFNQVVNDKTEKGSCFLEFPGKLKCDYFDANNKFVPGEDLVKLIHRRAHKHWVPSCLLPTLVPQSTS